MTDQVKATCQMLETALEMEKKGMEFYEKASQTCKLEECRRIFGMLVDDEKTHQARLKKIHQSLTGGQGWCEWDDQGKTHDDLYSMIKEAASEHGQSIGADSSDIEALQTAMDIEAEGLKFYKDKLEAASQEMEKKFLGQIVKEERTHYRTLSDMKFYLEDPAGWFREQEKTGLDGA